MVFPSGPLRENFESIKNAKIILINGVKDENLRKKFIMKIKMYLFFTQNIFQ